MRINTKFVPKNWGYELWLVNNDLYCGKILFVAKDKYLSWHLHINKDETFHILEGSGILLISTTSPDQDEYENIKMAVPIEMKKGDSFHIPPGKIHRFIAKEDTKIIEISTHHEDSDSIRLLPSCELK